MRLKCATAVQILLITMMIGFMVPTSAEASLMLYSIASKDDDTLYRLDPSDASNISSVTITLPGETVSGGVGLATHPLTGDLWALLRIGSSDRELVTLNPFTGVATSIGSTSESKFQGLAFDAAGILFGVREGDDTLYTLGQTDATATSFLTGFADDDDPQVIAFNPDDGLLYHAGGSSVFETIDLVTPFDITDIDISGTALEDDQVQALTYWEDEGVFLWKQDNGSGPLYEVTSLGVPTLIGTVGHQSRGLAFFDDEFEPNGTEEPVIPEPATMLLFGSGLLGAFVRKRRRS